VYVCCCDLQSVALCSSNSTDHPGELLLATVDAFGAGSISRLRPAQQYTPAAATAADGDGTAAAGPATPPEVIVQSALRPTDACREGGWAGVTFSGSSGSSGGSSGAAAGPSLLATARCFAKDVCIYDASSGKALRSFACVQNPYALSFLPAGVLGGSDASILAAAEGHSVALWDVRASGGCVQRYCPGAMGQTLYSVAWSTAQVGRVFLELWGGREGGGFDLNGCCLSYGGEGEGGLVGTLCELRGGGGGGASVTHRPGFWGGGCQGGCTFAQQQQLRPPGYEANSTDVK
jgi:hypothetical protein